MSLSLPKSNTINAHNDLSLPIIKTERWSFRPRLKWNGVFLFGWHKSTDCRPIVLVPLSGMAYQSIWSLHQKKLLRFNGLSKIFTTIEDKFFRYPLDFWLFAKHIPLSGRGIQLKLWSVNLPLFQKSVSSLFILQFLANLQIQFTIDLPKERLRYHKIIYTITENRSFTEIKIKSFVA